MHQKINKKSITDLIQSKHCLIQSTEIIFLGIAVLVKVLEQLCEHHSKDVKDQTEQHCDSKQSRYHRIQCYQKFHAREMILEPPMSNANE